MSPYNHEELLLCALIDIPGSPHEITEENKNRDLKAAAMSFNLIMNEKHIIISLDNIIF